MFCESFACARADVVEASNTELMDCGFKLSGYVTILREQVFSFTVSSEELAAAALTAHHREVVSWVTRMVSADGTDWDSHVHRSLNYVGYSFHKDISICGGSKSL